ncbi:MULTISPECIES: MIP/aquaporin family protein [unclassified Fusobacterium]|uniref:MIP/aquaporin family protein n=1 Tax=unclassified Fusobacterium TaxID=2648384 RepID=UPI0026041356|nr:MIP/aquaporin family protein [Fusobacterium sp.]
MTASAMYLAEFLGTAFLLLLGNGINMTLSLNKSYGKGGGWMVTCFGWGIAVSMAAYLTGWVSGAHLNPALTIALAVDGALDWALVPGYIIAQVLGGIVGAILAYLTYKNLMDEEPNPATKLGVFSTGPAIPNKFWNVVTEAVGTAILVIGILAIGYGKNMVEPGIKPFLVGMLISVIGMATGGATGFAINPARDLGPRIAHAILPIKGKGDSNWGYAWVPIVGPIIGALIGIALFNFFSISCVACG